MAAVFCVRNESGPPSMVNPSSWKDVIFPPHRVELSINVESDKPRSCRVNAVASPLMPPPMITVLVIGPSRIESRFPSAIVRYAIAEIKHQVVAPISIIRQLRGWRSRMASSIGHEGRLQVSLKVIHGSRSDETGR
jgi:hypothetical protein